MIARILAVALLCALVGALLDGLGFKSKKLFAILCALMLFSALIEPLGRLFGGLASLLERTGLSDALTCALRVVGIGYAVGFTADICKELGENLVATALTVVGRIEIFICAYPYFEKLILLGMELLE